MAGEVLCDTEIKLLMDSGVIIGAEEDLVNPGSLDLRLSNEKWKLLGSALPLPGQPIKELIESNVVDSSDYRKEDFYIDRSQPYLFKLMESLNLPNGISARMFNKSGRGRIGTSVKGVCDGIPRYNEISKNYSGELYVEVCATTFPELIIPEETAMPQIRFYNGDPSSIKGWKLELLLREEPILVDQQNKPIKFSQENLEKMCLTGRFTFTADLSRELLLYRAKKDMRTIDLSKKNYYDPEDFFEEVKSKNGEKGTIIHPGEFVLIHSNEKIRLPPTIAAEIAEYTSEIGDLKSHYAGLINPGHGYDPEKMRGDHIVFEVRARDTPISIQHGQELAQFEIFRMSQTPEIEYRKVQSTDYDGLASILPVQFKKDK